jgi:hypothetical protein
MNSLLFRSATAMKAAYTHKTEKNIGSPLDSYQQVIYIYPSRAFMIYYAPKGGGEKRGNLIKLYCLADIAEIQAATMLKLNVN